MMFLMRKISILLVQCLGNIDKTFFEQAFVGEFAITERKQRIPKNTPKMQ